jgi:hypothetical protein
MPLIGSVVIAILATLCILLGWSNRVLSRQLAYCQDLLAYVPIEREARLVITDEAGTVVDRPLSEASGKVAYVNRVTVSVVHP